ncbi:ROK family protein [Oscillatoria sp. FACHB-1407]|uniref:ROK family protein n=1 Tax=Oscillatoria sp. FACHB-1407 TaxID=2692847 RepID=UPI0016886014|nr:ROK family protein [Oscillatoria sp. FACHB-1407]MBD2463539.1 ROK family protein [Oscillatoria sp. FACHB-1407]
MGDRVQQVDSAHHEVYLGNAMQSLSLLYILINQGVGSGIIVNNQVFRGAYGTAGKISTLMSDPPGQDDLELWTHNVAKDALLDRSAAGWQSEESEPVRQEFRQRKSDRQFCFRITHKMISSNAHHLQACWYSTPSWANSFFCNIR